MDHVVCFILGGGLGGGLYPLTRARSVPAVPLAGKYRLIDVPVSNCLNSRLGSIFILAQYQSVSLHRHISNTYKMDPFHGGFVEVLSAQQTNETSDWYRGTADALRQNMRYADREGVTDVLVLSADQLYRMDFEAMVQGHRASKAACTIGVTAVGPNRVRRMGALSLDQGNWVRRFVEKPSREHLDDLVRPDPEDPVRPFLANMGIYLFQWKVLNELLDESPHMDDLVTQVLPRLMGQGRLRAHRHHGYWEDLGTIQSYHSTHMALTTDHPPFDFHAPEGTIYTRMRNLPGSRVHGSSVRDTLISDGCEIGTGCVIERCVIGVRSILGEKVLLRDCVLQGANEYESADERRVRQGSPEPPLGIGENTVIEGAILDKNYRIGRNCRLVNRSGVNFADGPFYAIRDGILILPNSSVVPDNTVL
ncbi:MAG: glucose-1-phosphate adenylyltransferase [Gemmataceae bacterium]|jgi:glucose-1-phosphate adenylyltransferase|nr:glucose-1-phosphate adenylyltransferase [Gemmataceae bacterium]